MYYVNLQFPSILTAIMTLFPMSAVIDTPFYRLLPRPYASCMFAYSVPHPLPYSGDPLPRFPSPFLRSFTIRSSKRALTIPIILLIHTYYVLPILHYHVSFFIFPSRCMLSNSLQSRSSKLRHRDLYLNIIHYI